MSLFQLGNFTLHSGQQSDFKIDCDALTGKDWDALASLVKSRFEYRFVEGIPSGGTKLYGRLYDARQPRRRELPILIVDDVLTTGQSMEQAAQKWAEQLPDEKIIGVVVFARGPCPYWVTPIFQMW